MTDSSEPPSAAVRWRHDSGTAIPWIRLAVGLIQGLALYGLFEAIEHRVWPATDPYVLMPLVLVLLLTPPALMVWAGHLRPQRLAAWGLAFAGLLTLFAVHGTWRATDIAPAGAGSLHHALPSPALFALSIVFIFIATALVHAGETDRRPFAAYDTYFDVSWKLAVQLQFSLAFVGAFWALLFAGSALFQTIGLDFLQRLLRKAWFSMPATTLALAIALHLTDVRPALVRHIRTLLLSLQSWLLPLLTLIVGGFLASVPFQGLEKLWATRHATALLLGVCAALVVLINTVFQQGPGRDSKPRLLRLAARVACLLLLPMVAIAAYALSLRIDQHGLSEDRIAAFLCLTVASAYALGYAAAALRRDGELALIAPTNVLTACGILVLLAAVLSPLADPARIAVNSQLARLAADRVDPKDFDYAYLRFDAARYGRDALDRLSREGAGSRSAEVVALARQSQQRQNRWEQPNHQVTSREIASSITVKTPGAVLPDDFAGTDWQQDKRRWMLPGCLTARAIPCDAFVGDFTGQGNTNVLLWAQGGHLGLFDRRNGHWALIAHRYLPAECNALREDLAAGHYRLQPSPVAELDVQGRHLVLEPILDNDPGCH